MTAVFNLLSTSTSGLSPNNIDPISSSLLANTKFSKTLILQPPVCSENKPSNLLAKRYKASELGDLLLKKIKTQGSTNNSSEGSPQPKETSEEYDSSMLEEIESPSTRSDYEHAAERGTDHRMIDEALLPQRSISTPIAFHQLLIKSSRSGTNDPQRQVKHALDVLQKKMMLEQNASTLKDLILKVKLAHEPLVIPPLMPSTSFSESPVKKLLKKNGEEDPEVIYGEVEYPFLSMSTPFQTSELNSSTSKTQQKGSAKKEKNSKKQKSKNSEDSSPSQDGFKFEGLLEIRDFLSATRAETQKSESDLSSSIREMTEALSKVKDVRKRKNKKEESQPEQSKRGSKKEKEQEKPKARQSKRDMPSPLLPAKRKMVDRKKSKWQGEQGGNKEDF